MQYLQAYNSASLFLLLVMFAAGADSRLSADTTPNAPANFLQDGQFNVNGKASLSGWNEVNPALGATTDVEGAETYASASTTDSTSICGIQQSIPLHSEWSRILLRGDIRTVYQDVAPTPTAAGAVSSSFIGVALTWVDKAGNKKPVTNAQSWQYTTPGWVEINQMFDVPPGAVTLLVSPEVSHAKATASFKDLNLSAWVSTLQDGFSGSAVDPARWGVSVGKHNVGAGEQEWFSTDEVTVANNMLRIRGEQKPSNGYPYQSGQISTIGKFQQLYGIFEFQLKLPVTMGAWPAAYLLSSDDDWPPEIDVEELSGADPGTVIETNHYPDEYGRHRSSSVNFSSAGLDRTQWHTYSVVWEPGEVAWYIDGIYKGTTGQPYDDASNVAMYITINLAIGAFGGDPSQSTWPQDFYCRQVSVYQRTDIPLPLYPEDSPEITLPNNTATLSAITCSPASAFKVTWKLIDGPGPVKIANAHAVTTTATFRAAGMYRFSITMANGAVSSVKQLLVYVNSSLGKS